MNRSDRDARHPLGTMAPVPDSMGTAPHAGSEANDGAKEVEAASHRLITRIGFGLVGWAAFAAALGLWQAWASAAHVQSVVATFSSAVRAFGTIVTGSALRADVLPSIYEVLLGFVVASLIGIALGLVIGTFRSLDPWVRPVIEFMRAVPPPLIIPIAMLIVGLSGNLVVTVIVFGAVWPVLLNTTDGARRVEPVFLDTAKVFHLQPWTVIATIVLPASSPMIMAGLRVALSTSLIMMILAEMLASSNGIGYLILTSQQTFTIPFTYGGVLILAVLGWLLDSAFLIAERRLLRWNSEYSGGAGV